MFWSFAALGTGFLAGIATARTLGPSDRGMLALVVTAVSLTALVAAFGTNVAIRALLHRDTRASVRAYARASMILGVLYVGSAIVIAGGLVIFAGEDGHSYVVLAVAAVALAVTAFGSAQTLDMLNAIGSTQGSAAVNCAGATVTLICLVPMMLAGADVPAVVIAYALGFLARWVIGVWLLQRRGVRLSGTPRGSSKHLVKRGGGFLGMSLGQALTFRADQLFLGLFATTEAVGLYAVAAAPVSVTVVIASSFGQVIMRDAAKGDLNWSVFVRTSGASTLLTAGVGGLLVIAAPYAVPLLYGHEYADAVPVMQMLMCAQVLLSPYLIASRALAGLGQARQASTSGTVGLGVMVAALFIFAPGMGAMGGALAAVMAYSSMSAMSVIAAVRYMR